MKNIMRTRRIIYCQNHGTLYVCLHTENAMEGYTPRKHVERDEEDF